MEPLSVALQRVRPGLGRPDPSSPEWIERNLLEVKLWPSARLEADLAAARAELARIAEGNARRRDAAGRVSNVEHELELARTREAIQGARPAGCWCLGLGGHSRVWMPGLDGEPIGHWRVWCSCGEAQLQREQLQVLVSEAERVRRQQVLDRLWGSLPAGFRDWTLESLAKQSAEHARLSERVVRWTDTDAWLFLHGRTGRAKTGAAIGALRVLAERGQTALFQETSSLLERLRTSYADGETFDTSRDDRWESLLGVDVLLLDDLGAERHRASERVDWATERLWLLVSYRHRELKRTIVTSNHSLTELVDILGHPRTPSRIGEAAGEWVIDVSDLPNLRVRRSA